MFKAKRMRIRTLRLYLPSPPPSKKDRIAPNIRDGGRKSSVKEKAEEKSAVCI